MKKIQLDEHVYLLPPPPKSQNDVLFVKEKKQMQFWRRQQDIPNFFFDFIPGYTKVDADATIYNSEGRLMTLSMEDTRTLIRFRDRELYRRKHGVWFMNNGELEYVAGNHYFLLQWGEMHGYVNDEHEGCKYSINGMRHPDYGSAFGMFREFQRDIFYFIDLVEKDPDSAGGFIGKAKKTGVTQAMSLVYLNESTMIRQKRFAMMSKSHPDCKGTNMMLLQHALERMPMIMKPRIKNINQSKVVFDKPKQNTITGSSKQLLEQSQASGFQTFIEALPTKEDGFDGPKIYRSWIDEFMKCESPYPQQLFDKSSEATKLQHEIIGKQFLTCYPPEDNKKGYFESRKIWAESTLATKNAINQTKSGLYNYFVSALNATEGTFNWYGKADMKEAFRKNHARRDAVAADRRALQRLKRQYPETVKEMWEAGGAGSAFNNLRISEQVSDLEMEEKEGAIFFIEGNIDWSNGYMSPVVFTEITMEEKAAGKTGQIRLFQKLHPEEVNWVYNNKSRDTLGNWTPNPNTTMVGSLDPTDYKQSTDVMQGSKNAIYFGNVLDSVRNTKTNSISSNVLFGEYFDRPDDPDELYDFVVKLIMWLGLYMIIEANKGWVVTRLKKDGLANFLLIWDQKLKQIRPYKHGDELILINTTTHMIDEYCRAISRYIRQLQEGEQGVDWLKHIKSIRLLMQLMDFDPLNTKVFDLVVAFGYWRLGIEAMAYIKEQRDKENAMYEQGMMEGLIGAIISDDF